MIIMHFSSLHITITSFCKLTCHQQCQIIVFSLQTNMSPASVYARLVAAREQEKMEREKRQLQISALESS